MKRFQQILLIGFINSLLITPVCSAQTHQENILEEVIENSSVNNDVNESDWEGDYEDLLDRFHEPLNLNIATRSQLEQFPFLSCSQIEQLLAYIFIHKQMRTINELQLVEGMDQKTIKLLLPFVRVEVINNNELIQLKTLLKQALKYGRNKVVTRLDIPFYNRKGYQQAYKGPAVYNAVRYEFKYRENVYAGVTAEKDAGEPFGALGNKCGYDYYSFYLLIKGLNRLKTLNVGNYKLHYGQGLVFGSSFLTGKSTYSLSLYRSMDGIKKKGSTDEYDYFCGIAAAVGLNKQFTLSAFYSNRLYDGVNDGGVITSIQKNGWHRTLKEMDHKHQLNMQLIGNHLTYQQGQVKLGMTGAYYWLNHPYEPVLKPYSKYNIRGRCFYNGSVDYMIHGRYLSFEGETAVGKCGFATVHDLRYVADNGVKLLLLHRFYAYNYWGFFAQAFSEGSTVQNENGWYLAGECNPSAHTRLFGSVDLFSFPWKKYQINKPSSGTDVGGQVDYFPRREVNMYVRYRYKQGKKNVTGTSGEVVLPIYHHSLRYRATYDDTHWLGRITCDINQFHYHKQSLSYGYLCSGRLGYHCSALHAKVDVQATYFDTDDYDTRVYNMEKGLLYSWSVPSFFGRGWRFAAYLRYEPNAHWLVNIKFGETIYADRYHIGSGNDEINGNKKADAQMQLCMKF